MCVFFYLRNLNFLQGFFTMTIAAYKTTITGLHQVGSLRLRWMREQQMNKVKRQLFYVSPDYSKASNTICSSAENNQNLYLSAL